MKIFKYPRIQHIEGSKFQNGDQNLNSVPFSQIQNKHLIIEEKIDGANSAISFSDNGDLLLQSRGHFLTGGLREKHFNLFKVWSNKNINELFDLLSNKYIMFGEWMHVKHTSFYDLLPNYFIEFDIYDKSNEKFLSTKKRKELINKSEIISSIDILFEGEIYKYTDLLKLLDKSHYKSEYHLENLKKNCIKQNLNFEKILNETDKSNLMEGLFIKIENDDNCLEQYKYVRNNFSNQILNSETNWLNKPIIPNKLK